MEFSPNYKTDKRIKGGIALGVLTLASFAGYGRYNFEGNALEETRHIVNSIRLGKRIENKSVSIAGILENIGGNYSKTSSDCYFMLHVDKARRGYTPTSPIRVILSFDDYNDMAARRGEKFNAIVSGVIRKNRNPSDNNFQYQIGQSASGEREDAQIQKMWIRTP